MLEKAKATGGQNLVEGLKHLLADLERGKGRLKISMVDEKAFEVGRNVAASEGEVVYQNDLMQLIQYAPTTETVFKRPLLLVPPWINKFYMLDLQPKNSFIRHAVDQGHTVFVISWANPTEEHAQKTFEDYLLEGPLSAMERDRAGDRRDDDQHSRLLHRRHSGEHAARPSRGQRARQGASRRRPS